MSIIVSGIILPTTKGSIKYGGVDIEQVDVVQNGSRTTVWKIAPDGIWEDGKWNRNSYHVCSPVYSGLFGIDPISGYEGFHPNGNNSHSPARIELSLPKNRNIKSIYIEISKSTICNLNVDDRAASSFIMREKSNSDGFSEIAYFGQVEKQNHSGSVAFKFTPRRSFSSTLNPIDSYNDPLCFIEFVFNINDWFGIKNIRVLDSTDNPVNIL